MKEILERLEKLRATEKGTELVLLSDLDAAIADIAAMLAEPVTVWHPASRPPSRKLAVLVTDGEFQWVTIYFGEWHHGPARNYPTHWTELPQLPEVK